jgi:hypothetical protein
MATLIVLTLDGKLRQQITAIATNQAAFDPGRRRVISSDEELVFPPQFGRPAAIMVNGCNQICVCLDRWRATTPAWIEDAFLQAQRAETRARTLPESFS